MEILSTSNQFFKKPSSIQIDNIKYNDITSLNKVEFTDGDNIRQAAYNMATRDAEYWAHTSQGKLKASIKYYHRPVSRVFDGVRYDNIISNNLLENGNKLYRSVSRYGSEKKILVSPENHVLNNKQKKSVADIVKKSFVKMMKCINLL